MTPSGPTTLDHVLTAAFAWKQAMGNDGGQELIADINSVDQADLLRRFGIDLAATADAWIRETTSVRGG